MPITAQASGVIPGWLAWLIGVVPAVGVALYFLVRRRAAATQSRGEARQAGGE